jgi:hypothetical protein
MSVTDTRAVSRDLFSATIGSVFCAYVGQPFDTVKVRMQTNPDHYSGVVTSTTGIIRNEVRYTIACLVCLGVTNKSCDHQLPTATDDDDDDDDDQ